MTTLIVGHKLTVTLTAEEHAALALVQGNPTPTAEEKTAAWQMGALLLRAINEKSRQMERGTGQQTEITVKVRA